MANNEYVRVITNPDAADELSEAEHYVLQAISSSKHFAGWTLYVQPHLNSMRPAMIATHPRKGIVLIKGIDWHVQSPEYEASAQVRGAHGNYYTDDPVSQVVSYKDLILKYELDTFLEAVEGHGDAAFDMMTPVVYFHHASREDALRFVGDVDPKTCLIWSRDEVDALRTDDLERDDERFPSGLFIERSTFARGPERSMQKLVTNVANVLQPTDSEGSSKGRLSLTSEQEKLLPIQSGSIRRWGGVAGSGKTALIATKAADAIAAGERVLVLTYNSTLRHYIREWCSRQFVGGQRERLRSHLTIAHFHGFLKIVLAECGIQVPQASVEAYPDWSMDAIRRKTHVQFPDHLRFDSILIDEGQDFSGDWLRFLKNVYTEQGELLVMYDEAQSIYDDQGVWITDPDEIAGIGFKGQVGHLSMTHRLPNRIVHQIDRLSGLFDMEKRLDVTSEQIDLFTKITWENVDGSDDRMAILKDKIASIVDNNESTVKDVTVLTMTKDTGLEVVQALEDTSWNVSHVFDRNGTKAQRNERDEKWMFQPRQDRLKVASYHSYKGWESSHVILLVEGTGEASKQWKHMLDALYISLTRVSAFSTSRSFTCINNCREFDAVEKYFV